uniref:glutathione transferase n=1 Tax=Phascolarctos cinereus TaxID=38626 RepID=A0A6P5L1V6_PHACI|nr:glutathione S-transferase-like [Phascolarctos cinereus]
MAGKPRLYYFDGRGRMEAVRWLLAAAGVEFEEVLFETAEDLQNLSKGGKLMYKQVPMVEIDGMKMAQTRAILRYIAAKYSLYGKDLKEQVLYSNHFLHVYNALKDHGKNYLVGNQLSWADIHLLELILMVEECKSDALSAFPKLQEFKTRVSKLPRIQKFFQPGSARRPPMDEACLKAAKKIFKLEKGLFLKYSSTILVEL